MAHDTIQFLVLHRCDPSCNMARYYVLSIEPSLFGGATLIREWGRLGRSGQRRIELYENQSCAMEALETWLQRKQRRGYLLQGGQGRAARIGFSAGSEYSAITAGE
jgi:predicted DNA-binding WGR domain protein